MNRHVILTVLLVLAGPGFAQPRTDVHGDPLPDGAVARFGTVRYRIGWPGKVPATALSPDGKTLAVDSWYGITLWNVETGVPRARLPLPFHGPMEGLRHFAFSPDGKFFVRADGDLRIWDAVTGRERFAIELPDGGGTLAFFPGSSRFAIAAGGRPLSVYDAETGRRVSRLNVEKFAWELSPTGRYLLGESEDKLLLMDAKTGRVCTRFADLGDEHRSSVGFSADDRRLHVIKSGGQFLTFDTESGKQVEDVKMPAEKGELMDDRMGLTLSPDGNVAYLSSPFRPARRRDLKAGKWLEPLETWGRVIPLPDGKRVLLLGWDGLLRRFDLLTMNELPFPDGFERAPTVVPSPDGQRLAALAEHRLDVFAANGKLLWSALEDRSAHMHGSPDGRCLLVVGREQITVRDWATGKRAFFVTPSVGDTPFSRHVAFPPGSEQFMMTSELGRRVETFDLRTGQRVGAVAMKVIGALALAPDGHSLAVEERGEITLQDTATGRVRAVVKRAELANADKTIFPRTTFTEDSMFLVTWEAEAVAVLRDPITGERIHAVPTGKQGVPRTGSVSPGGLWLAVGADDGAVTLLDVATGTRINRWDGHHDSIDSMRFAGPGRLLTSSNDMTALMWNLRPKGNLTTSPWEAVSGDDPTEAYRAVWALAADPKGPDLLRAKIGPAKSASAERMMAWLADLASDRFAVREAATKELLDLGRLAEPTLRAARATSKTEEVVSRLDGLLKQIPRERSPTELVQARAVAAMEIAGTEAAIKVLNEWAAGASGARLTVDAKAALGRLAAGR